MLEVYRQVDGSEKKVDAISLRNVRHVSKIMGMIEVQASIVLERTLDLQVGDYVYHEGIKYTLNRDMEYQKHSDVQHAYTLVFEHPYYTLFDKLFMFVPHHVGANTMTATATVRGKACDFIEKIVDCMNWCKENNPLGVDTGWKKGKVDDSNFQTLTFDALSCRDTLMLVCQAFDMEFYFSGEDGKTINCVHRIENRTDRIFEQGREKGLYTVSQQNVDNGNTVTRIYPLGGTHNVPNNRNIADLNGRLIYSDENGKNYIENFQESDKVVEQKVVFDNIFPEFRGTITTVSNENYRIFTSNEIDFDLEDQTLIIGDNARVNFLTGGLMGVSFKFGYYHNSREITLREQYDETAFPNTEPDLKEIPNRNRRPLVGDQFNFTGIRLEADSPYVTNAVKRLGEAAKDWLDFHSRRRVKFNIEIDHRFMHQSGKPDLKVGDLVTLVIPEVMGKETKGELIRITRLEKELDTGALNATVSNYLDEKWEQRIEGQISQLKSTVSGGGGGGNIAIVEENDRRTPSDRNVFSSLRSLREIGGAISDFLMKIKGMFLRKDVADTAQEEITFAKGLTSAATARFENITLRNGFRSPAFIPGMFGEGFDLRRKSGKDNEWVLELQDLIVNGRLDVNETVIRQWSHIGAGYVFSAAGFDVDRVEELPDSYRVYPKSPEENNFVVNDQALCQTFQTDGTNAQSRRYWRLVTAVAPDRSWIDLSKTDAEAGSDAPEAGDAVIQLGHRSNTVRQGAVVISSYGDTGPFFQSLRGITNFDLSGRTQVFIGNRTEFNVDSLKIRNSNGSWIDAGLEIDTVRGEVNSHASRITTAENSLTGLTTRVSSAETGIQQNADAIALRATRTEIDTLTGRVNEAKSEILQMPNRISIQVQSELRNSAAITSEFEIDTRSLDPNLYYPVTIQLPATVETYLEIIAHTTAVWGRASDGLFSVRVVWESQGSGWGATHVQRRVLSSHAQLLPAGTPSPVLGLRQVTQSSQELVYVRGGAFYRFRSSRNTPPQLHTGMVDQPGFFRSFAPHGEVTWPVRAVGHADLTPIQTSLMGAGIDIERNLITLTAGRTVFRSPHAADNQFVEILGSGRLRADEATFNNVISHGGTFHDINAVNGVFSGEVRADSGYVGGFRIADGLLQNKDDFAAILFQSGRGLRASIGANTLPATAGIEVPAHFQNHAPDSFTDNIALLVSASASRFGVNDAIRIITGCIAGMRHRLRSASFNLTLSLLDTAVALAANNITITLPNANTVENGQFYWINPRGMTGCTLRTASDGTVIRSSRLNSVTSHETSSRQWHFVMYNATHREWLLSWMG